MQVPKGAAVSLEASHNARLAYLCIVIFLALRGREVGTGTGGRGKGAWRQRALASCQADVVVHNPLHCFPLITLAAGYKGSLLLCHSFLITHLPSCEMIDCEKGVSEGIDTTHRTTAAQRIWNVCSPFALSGWDLWRPYSAGSNLSALHPSSH